MRYYFYAAGAALLLSALYVWNRIGSEDINEDARQHRIRQLNRQGWGPGDME